ncbi:hypothetical protein NPIL_339731 [Nephila pilipes]|uniref:Uncharacterized protein n=1 Tax=Nephila pilipes TaxID=299642 RepID=A0A8X6ML26_NEPPI|nr:hypothetical protein NPIL_339731 [Nephila pilipes]
MLFLRGREANTKRELWHMDGQQYPQVTTHRSMRLKDTKHETQEAYVQAVTVLWSGTLWDNGLIPTIRA